MNASRPTTGKRGRLPTTRIAIGEVMADGAPRTPREIAEILGLTPGAASAAMGRMARAGALQKLGAGLYRCENVELLHLDSALPLDDRPPAHNEKPSAGTRPPALDRVSASQVTVTTPQNGSQHDGSLRDQVARAAFAAKLWLKDAALFRFSDYHWEKRRRRMHDHDRKTGRAPAR
jgi:hypothetical protein